MVTGQLMPLVGILPICMDRTDNGRPERMGLIPVKKLIRLSEVIVSRCRGRESGMRMVAMDEKDGGVICVVEREEHVLYVG
jgi:hypothetical protein